MTLRMFTFPHSPLSAFLGHVLKRGHLLALLALLLLILPGEIWAEPIGYDLEQGINTASVIDYPTALDQSRTNVVTFATEIVDIGQPDLRQRSAFYGLQFGNVQFSLDSQWATRDSASIETYDLSHATGRAKLRVVNLDEYRTHIAVGLLGRWTDKNQM